MLDFGDNGFPMKRIVNTLKQTDIFDQFSHTQLELVAEIGKEKNYSAGELIIREGTDDNELYVIAEGEVEILVNPGLVSKSYPAPEHPEPIAILRRGQSFGEIALVDQGLRSASVVAGKEGVRVIEFDRESLLSICQEYPLLGFQMMFNLAADLAMKMRTTDLRSREQYLYGDRSE